MITIRLSVVLRAAGIEAMLGLYVACLQALRRVASVIAGIEVDYEGTKEFYASRINEVLEQYQIFIEPKGGQLLLSDAWKEDLLLQLEKEAVPVKVFADDNHYKIWGFPFYNAEQRDKEFKAAMARVL